MKKANLDKWDINKSPVGWYVASVLLRFEWYDEDKDNMNRRCLAWENQILIKAIDPEEAYAKAVAEGKLHEESESWEADNEARKGRWRFEGLTSLLPIYEELGDLSEIKWREYENKSVRKVKSWVKPKEQLEVFKSD
jgi:hypothetical protein